MINNNNCQVDDDDDDEGNGEFIYKYLPLWAAVRITLGSL